MKNVFSIWFTGICAVLLPLRAVSIAVSDYAAGELAPTNAGYSFNWDYIYKYKNSSSVAVDHYWILTAAHVANDSSGQTNLLIGGETYIQKEIVFHPSADLALVRYDKPFPGYYFLHTGELHNGKNGGARVYHEMIMSGFGRTGVVTQTTFLNGPGGNGTKRWGTNRATGYESPANANDESSTFTTQIFEVDFYLSDTPYEAGANTHDSGSPILIENGGSWKVAGITLYRPSNRNNYAGMIPDYVGWIESVITDYDSDMDGLPDWWEQEQVGHETSMVSTVDPDDDGFSNYDEWLADTDPDNTSSYLQFLSYTNASSLAFSCSADREYRIEYCTDLTNLNWQTEVDWFAPIGTQTVQSVSTAESSRFYRVRVKLP